MEIYSINWTCRFFGLDSRTYKRRTGVFGYIRWKVRRPFILFEIFCEYGSMINFFEEKYLFFQLEFVDLKPLTNGHLGFQDKLSQPRR